MKALGVNHLKAHREGKRLTQRQVILAKCAECACEYHDGKADCEIQGCPLHPWQPYRGRRLPNSVD